ncbi:hypothetical protein WN48_01036 [Eufriesea mexicana]|nr:hypothetical protein WN48_01036 [Eufriesea mexicana]
MSVQAGYSVTRALESDARHRKKRGECTSPSGMHCPRFCGSSLAAVYFVQKRRFSVPECGTSRICGRSFVSYGDSSSSRRNIGTGHRQRDLDLERGEKSRATASDANAAGALMPYGFLLGGQTVAKGAVAKCLAAGELLWSAVAT